MLFYNLLSLSNGVTSYEISKHDTSRGLERHCKWMLSIIAFETLGPWWACQAEWRVRGYREENGCELSVFNHKGLWVRLSLTIQLHCDLSFLKRLMKLKQGNPD